MNVRSGEYLNKNSCLQHYFEDVSKINKYNLEQCISRKYNYILIDKNYQINIDDII